VPVEITVKLLIKKMETNAKDGKKKVGIYIEIESQL
jgi:hypothetical protein